MPSYAKALKKFQSGRTPPIAAPPVPAYLRLPMINPATTFDRHGPPVPTSPVVLSVPHAGRDYPAAMVAALRVPVAALQSLEDRHVDRLAIAARGQETMFVQRPARAWIDLNRSEHERDPRIDGGASAGAAVTSLKLRSGLGLVPRRVMPAGDIWRRRLSGEEVDARIACDHRPYHDALAAALAQARARFGVAVLLDIHSMPPLGTGTDTARIVFGDRFGQSAGARFVARIEAVADASGIAHALNIPYSGGHILDRHARPGAGIHAIQIEFDRSLYLDARLDSVGEGLAPMARMLRRMIDAVTGEAMAGPGAIAAE